MTRGVAGWQRWQNSTVRFTPGKAVSVRSPLDDYGGSIHRPRYYYYIYISEMKSEIINHDSFRTLTLGELRPLGSSGDIDGPKEKKKVFLFSVSFSRIENIKKEERTE